MLESMTAHDVSLRPATDADREFAFRVKEESMGEYVEETFGWDEAAQRALHARRFTPSQTRIIVWESRDVGVLAVHDAAEEVTVQQLFLLPEAQGRGLGGQVLDTVIDDARALGRPVALRVLTSNPRARAFYERHGFAVTEETDTHWYLRTPM